MKMLNDDQLNQHWFAVYLEETPSKRPYRLLTSRDDNSIRRAKKYFRPAHRSAGKQAQ
jgi:hypothetical protein